jgi:hypothetical protein
MHDPTSASKSPNHMPRPKRFREGITPQQIADAYANGHSTRELEKLTGLSRWVVSGWCLQNGIPMRQRDDALQRQRYFASIEADRQAAQHCCWPHCDNYAGRAQLCDTHWAELDPADTTRMCAWPRCQQTRTWRPAGHPLCDYHQRKAEGDIG